MAFCPQSEVLVILPTGLSSKCVVGGGQLIPLSGDSICISNTTGASVQNHGHNQINLLYQVAVELYIRVVYINW